jgi:tetratricopeptide (TPR) repeat protein
MAGGYRNDAGSRCARRLAAALLGGLISFSSGPSETVVADVWSETAAQIDDCSTEPSEKSIVVDSGKAPETDPDVALVTDEDAGLEPIANVSEYEPDLAEESADRLQEALVPELADPPPGTQVGVAPITPGTSEEPAADDVCVEEEITATDIQPTPDLQPASFNGVTPGVTSRTQVLAKWTNAQEKDTTGATLTYSLGKFPSIAISFKGDLVESIRIQLSKPDELDSLVAKLGLAELTPAVAVDGLGQPISTCFPERGVTLSHADAGGGVMATDDESAARATEVNEIVVRRIMAGPFVLRAERSAVNAYAQRTADLQTALKITARNTKALLLLSEVKLATGKAISAEQLAGQACRLEPENDEYRLQWAKCLMRLARYDEAVEQTRMVLEGSTATLRVRATALEQMGQLAALGSKDVQTRAVPLHNKAIELADSLAANDEPAIRAAAHRVLLDAHLATAERIALGDWAQKDKVVAQWISRASALAEEMIAAGEGDLSLRLQVANSALAAGGRLHPPINPKPWVGEAEQAVNGLDESLSSDPLARDVVHWQLGMVYFQAAEVQHRRGEAEAAIQYGELADATLTPLADGRTELPDTRYALGRLYFQIGAVHAVHKQDHDMACQWYDRAADLLLESTPVTPLANPGQHGDALVSMGVSYWELGQRDRAYELTAAGVRLVDQGVAEGLLAADTANVPRGNLNAMARALGKVEPSTLGGGAQMAQRPRVNTSRAANTRQQQSRMAGRQSGSGGRR